MAPTLITGKIVEKVHIAKILKTAQELVRTWME